MFNILSSLLSNFLIFHLFSNFGFGFLVLPSTALPLFSDGPVGGSGVRRGGSFPPVTSSDPTVRMNKKRGPKRWQRGSIT